MKMIATLFTALTILMTPSCKKKDVGPEIGFQIVGVQAGSESLSFTNPIGNTEIPVDQSLVCSFSVPLDTTTFLNSVSIKKEDGSAVAIGHSFQSGLQAFILDPVDDLEYGAKYTIDIINTLRGSGNEAFSGSRVQFTTEKGNLPLDSVVIDNKKTNTGQRTLDVSYTPSIRLYFGSQVNAGTIVENNISLAGRGGPVPLQITLSTDKKVLTLSTGVVSLNSLSKYTLTFDGVKGNRGEAFRKLSMDLFTRLDTTDKFPRITDEELMTKVQRETFRYFWEGAHQASGMAYERGRNGSPDVITTGGSGFGIMSIIVGVERGFVTRTEALSRWELMTNYLRKANRFHGAWPHWFNANAGTVRPFGANDDGGDLVETAFMTQGLMTVRQYLNRSDARESKLVARIDSLIDGVEYDWYRRGGQEVLYWHWSPRVQWLMNFALRGYNETMITYVMAAASRTHTIPQSVYIQGFTRNGGYRNGKNFYGIRLPLGFDFGGPLFFAHYSFMGLKPNNLRDQYASFQEQNVNHSLINYTYCVTNPKRFAGYGPNCWGLTASDVPNGYRANEPNNDIGVISPTAALSSMPYTPQQSMAAMRHFYYKLGDKIWGPQGFYDAFSPTDEWYARSYLAIDQGPIIVMIENHRSGLLWNLFMSSPEVQQGLTKLGFTY